jgi:hypothetical protein
VNAALDISYLYRKAPGLYSPMLDQPVKLSIAKHSSLLIRIEKRLAPEKYPQTVASSEMKAALGSMAPRWSWQRSLDLGPML